MQYLFIFFQQTTYNFPHSTVLDDNGRLILRDEYLIDGINCSPDTFAIECIRLNKNCNKNLTRNEIKSHHYFSTVLRYFGSVTENAIIVSSSFSKFFLFYSWRKQPEP